MTRSYQVVGKSIVTPSCNHTHSISSRDHGYRLTCVLLAIVMLGMTSTVSAQTQLGANIEVEMSQLLSNATVSLSSDGSRLALGASNNDDNGSRSGHVQVFQWSGVAWLQLGDNINGEAAGDQSGESIALSADGTRVAIGAPGNNGNGADSGHVRVYQWSGTAWRQLGSDINGEAAGDLFGASVALSSDGHRVAIGAIGNDDVGTDSGHVRVYEWSGNTWTKLGPDIDGEADGDNFGRSISLSANGNRLAVGASWSSITELNAGYVRVYQWSGTSWIQLGPSLNGEAASDFFGNSVSLTADGNRLAVSAIAYGYRDGAGIVRTYRWTGTFWEQMGFDIEGEAAGDRSGRSVSLSSSGNRLAIGASHNSTNGVSSGQVRLFQWTGIDWIQMGSAINGDSSNDFFGTNVSLSSDGRRVASATGNANTAAESPSFVRVYDLSMFVNAFKINAGLTDAWYNPDTDGQGFFVAVFPDLGVVSLAWFTYDTELPPPGAIANLGDPGHRWLTAVGPIEGDHAMMEIEMTSGGLFDTPTEITRTDPPGSDGTIILTFDDCNTATVEYDIPSIGRQGIVPIRRVANDKIIDCEQRAAD